MIAVISASISGGRQDGILTGLGLSAAAILWVTLTVLGIEAFFVLFPKLAFSLRLIGAAYLLWLGVKSLRSAYSNDHTTLLMSTHEPRKHKLFLRGFLVSASNPKAAFFFGSILTAFVPIDASNMLLLSIIFFCGILSVILHSITATVFSRAAVISRFSKMHRTTAAIFGSLYCGLGFAVAYDTIHEQY